MRMTTIAIIAFFFIFSGCGATTTRVELICEPSALPPVVAPAPEEIPVHFIVDEDVEQEYEEIPVHFVVDGEQAARVAVRPAPITIFGAYTPEEVEAALEAADAHHTGCVRAQHGDREAWLCLP